MPPNFNRADFSRWPGEHTVSLLKRRLVKLPVYLTPKRVAFPARAALSILAPMCGTVLIVS